MKKQALILFVALLLCVVLAGCGGGVEPAPTPAVSTPAAILETPAPTPEPTPAQTPAVSLPVYGAQILDGVYPIEVSSSSSMFRIVDAQLTVAGEAMTAVLTLSGTGYEKLYMGTGEQALQDTDDKCMYFVEDGEGNYTYEVPVAALDMELDCAAWSFRKETWYDRMLVFQSALIPADAIVAPPLADGAYTIAVNLYGGSGRASIASPAALSVAGGEMTATITWSSPNYTYMLVNGARYDPIQAEGNSAFAIPIMLDVDMAVSAETIAMSQPHVIEYVLRFDSSTVEAS